jgi:exopolysaccharide biosynthesis WecB/TagA/CpsF family protein
VEVVGRANGYDSPAEQVLAEIAISEPDLVLVALGQPKQECWIYENRERIKAKIVCGVGALFDFLSGTVTRAPLPMRKLKLEWAYRLSCEPRRMFRRYVAGNPKFLLRAAMTRRRDVA